MKTFDFENSNPVGYVDILPNGNANIDIVGYVDSLSVFHHLNSKEIVELFPPKEESLLTISFKSMSRIATDWCVWLLCQMQRMVRDWIHLFGTNL